MPRNLVTAVASAIVAHLHGRPADEHGSARTRPRRTRRARRQQPDLVASRVADAVLNRLATASAASPRRSPRSGSPAKSSLAQTVAAMASQIVARLAPSQQGQDLPLDKIEI